MSESYSINTADTQLSDQILEFIKTGNSPRPNLAPARLLTPRGGFGRPRGGGKRADVGAQFVDRCSRATTWCVEIG